MCLERIGVDQSGNIDRTNDDTAIVFCPLDRETPNHKILVDSEVTSEVRHRIKPFYDDKGKFVSKFYAAALFYLLRDSIEEVSEVVMEQEYEGKMVHIVNITCCWIRDIHGSEADTGKFTIQPRQPDFHPDILAKKVLRRETEPDSKLDFSYFSDLL